MEYMIYHFSYPCPYMSNVTESQLFVGNFICQGNKWNLRKRNTVWTDHPDSLENYMKLFFFTMKHFWWSTNTASQSAVIISSCYFKDTNKWNPYVTWAIWGQNPVPSQRNIKRLNVMEMSRGATLDIYDRM